MLWRSQIGRTPSIRAIKAIRAQAAALMARERAHFSLVAVCASLRHSPLAAGCSQPAGHVINPFRCSSAHIKMSLATRNASTRGLTAQNDENTLRAAKSHQAALGAGSRRSGAVLSDITNVAAQAAANQAGKVRMRSGSKIEGCGSPFVIVLSAF